MVEIERKHQLVNIASARRLPRHERRFQSRVVANQRADLGMPWIAQGTKCLPDRRRSIDWRACKLSAPIVGQSYKAAVFRAIALINV